MKESKKRKRRRRERSCSRSRSKKHHARAKTRSRTRSPTPAGKQPSPQIDETPKGSKYNTPHKLIKSPSAITMYSPAVNKKQSPHPEKVDTDKLIIDFLKHIRLGSTRSSSDGSTSTAENERRSAERQRVATQQARADAEARVLESEKYKAGLENKGKNIPDTEPEIVQVQYVDPDDKFLAIDCHVDSALREKIAAGKYVELEKLLKRDKRFLPSKQDGTVELVRRDGSTYLVPSDFKDTQIGNVRRWEQAFKVYATIYTREHPTRVAEVWQYIESIHRAARSAPWENVANYDFTFRHLMEQNPTRSWAKNLHPNVDRNA